MKLEIELIPKTAWFKNLRSELSTSEWDKLRKDCYKKANYRCEICGGKGNRHPVECHEKWQYKGDTIILTGLIALCPSCHECKHIGLAQVRGRYEQALKHFMKVNNISRKNAEIYIDQCFETWYTRNNKEWKLDLSYLETLK